MKKLFALLALLGILTFGVSQSVFAQDDATTDETTTETTDQATEETTASATEEETITSTEETVSGGEEETLHQVIKLKFIEGGAQFMGFVLLAFILGLAVAIERIIYLNLSTTNTKKLLDKIEETLNADGVEAAKEVCRSTRGPVASIFYQGLDRSDEGIDMVEKSVVSYGSVQMGRLESGLTWLSLFITIAPMLGFMGTVLGMIDAFDQIQKAGDIQPQLVARGIKIALITTVTGLVVGMVLQIFYNYIVSKIDALVNNMEDASIRLVDILYKYNQKK
jgi:biopolymer transport protein ExbB